MGERCTVEGIVEHLVFQNEENGYTVLTLLTDQGEVVTVVGCIPCVGPGEGMTVTGTWVIQELALYLDTHRYDKEAYELYCNYQKMYERCLEEYKRSHGPINHTRVSQSQCYEWLNDPWPWEYCKNKED